jgi:hypothetical protein
MRPWSMVPSGSADPWEEPAGSSSMPSSDTVVQACVQLSLSQHLVVSVDIAKQACNAMGAGVGIHTV